MIVYALPVVGFLVGLLIISFGGGGGAVYIGILTVFFHVSPAVATSTSLATIIPTAAAGSVSHWKAGNVNVRLGFTMLSGGILGAIAGSLYSDALPETLYHKLTGIIMCLLALQMFVTFLRRKKNGKDGKRTTGRIKRLAYAKAVLFGVLGGAMSGLMGLSGSSPIVAGLTILGCSALETVGTSVLVLLGLSITGFLMHLGLGSVDWKPVGLLAIGTVSGGALGPVLLKHFDKARLEKVLHPVLLVMTAGMGILLLF